MADDIVAIIDITWTGTWVRTVIGTGVAYGLSRATDDHDIEIADDDAEKAC